MRDKPKPEVSYIRRLISP